MTEYARLPMHPHFMSIFEGLEASATNRNTVPEHPNPESLIPSNLFDSLPEPTPSHPSPTYNTPPYATKDTYAMSLTPDPKTPPYPGFTQPPPQSLSRLLALSQEQQWVYCPSEQAETWKPRRNEIEDLEHELKKQSLSSSSNAANGEEVDKERADSGQEQCRKEGKEEKEEGEVGDANVDDGKEEEEQQRQHPTRNLGPYPQSGRQIAVPLFKASSPPYHTTSNAHNPSTLQSQRKEEDDEQHHHHHHPTLNLGPYPQPSRGQEPHPPFKSPSPPHQNTSTIHNPLILQTQSKEFQQLLLQAQRNEHHPSPTGSPLPSPSFTPIQLQIPLLPHPNTSDANNAAAIEYLGKRLLQVQQQRIFEEILRGGREKERAERAEMQRPERKPYCWPPCESGTEE